MTWAFQLSGRKTMLQYDMTDTPLFRNESRSRFPNDAEIFAITVALLLVAECGYADLATQEFVLTDATVEDLAACIEQRAPSLMRDIGIGAGLRRRLAEFVGLRIGPISVRNTDASQQPQSPS